MAGNILFAGKRTEAAAILNRVGKSVTITEQDGTAATNQYGKVSDTDLNFVQKADEFGRRLYSASTDRDSQQLVQGGRLDEDSPRIALVYDTAAEEGDRVAFPGGETYVLDREVPRDTHTEFRATLVQ